MANEMENEFTTYEIDAVGEIMNISMGSAATAVSELLNAKVWITTPEVKVVKVGELNYDNLEPAICVKIVYVTGITGLNMMILKQDDVQLILNQLLGNPLVVSPDFEFDEMNISAVSEVMNQMMGASATALSDLLGMTVDISTPTPYIIEEAKFGDLCEMDNDQHVVAVSFNLTIDGVMNSEFMSVLSLDLAKTLSAKMIDQFKVEEEQKAAAAAAEAAAATAAQAPAAPPPAPAMPAQPQMPQGQPMPSMQPMQPMQPGQPAPQQMYQQPMYPPQGGYGYPNQYAAYGAYPPPMPPVNIQNAQLHQFDNVDFGLPSDQQDNLKLLMGVPLEISVEIGTATRKVKEILEFSQGTIIELERQAGAPVDVVVNGNLIARGDVVVIDDNFAVRITEIVKSQFMDSLGRE